jgi:Family of unknown function (DUF5684)
MLLASSGSGAAGALFFIVYLIVAVFVIAGLWKTFTKAGQAGWAAIIPILNTLVILKVVKRPLWWIILFLIPCVNFIAWIIVAIDLAKAYGHGTGFAIGLILLGPIFILILGFGSSTYQLEPEPLF